MKTLASMFASRGARSRSIAAAGAVAALLVLGLGGFALAHLRSGGTPVASVSKPSTCADAYRLLGLRPSQVTAAKAICLTQALAFSGDLSGSVGEAFPIASDDTGPTSLCVEPKRWTGLPQVVLGMAVGNKAFRLRITVPGRSEHEAITLNSLTNVVELTAVKDPSADWNQATGTLTLNPDATTGSIDASLERDVAGATPVRISGTWACGAPLAVAANSSAPCASFYALNQLASEDVERMTAQACMAEDLTFSGDITAHVDHGVTDLAKPNWDGTIEDNVCGQAYGAYEATTKFSAGDETFQIDFKAFQSPSVTAGQHPVANSLGPFVTLLLGSADPSKHGVFVEDHNVVWGAISGTITLAADLKSGTIDADFAGPFPDNFSHVHIAGTWRCAR